MPLLRAHVMGARSAGDVADHHSGGVGERPTKAGKKRPYWTALGVVTVLLAMGCGRRPGQSPFDVGAPAEVVSREYVVGHFEERSICDAGWTTGASGASEFDSCASRHHDTSFVSDKWFVMFRQCRGWTLTPPSSECGEQSTNRVEVADYFRYREAEKLIGHRVRSINDWTLVQR